MMFLLKKQEQISQFNSTCSDRSLEYVKELKALESKFGKVEPVLQLETYKAC